MRATIDAVNVTRGADSCKLDREQKIRKKKKNSVICRVSEILREKTGSRDDGTDKILSGDGNLSGVSGCQIEEDRVQLIKKQKQPTLIQTQSIKGNFQ